MIISKIAWGNPQESDFDLILDYYSGTKINSIKTSSVPLAQYWKETKRATAYILDKLGIHADDVSVYFEYPTQSYKNNKSSMSDVMIISDNLKIAIEAKYTEYQKSEYESIDKWYSKGKSENKINVLRHWKEIIAGYSNNNIDEHSILPYQFLHRTASACFGQPNETIVLFQLFWDKETKPALHSFIKQLERSIDIINPKNNLKYYVHEIEILNITSSDKDNVFQRMKEERIYKFGEERITMIGSV